MIFAISPHWFLDAIAPVDVGRKQARFSNIPHDPPRAEKARLRQLKAAVRKQLLICSAKS